MKSIRFKTYKYVGDPINAVKIFNEKEVDELAIIDISATKEKRSPNLLKIQEIASEAFMPLSYGGGITDIKQVKEILFAGVEKVIINKAVLTIPNLISEIADRFGSQSIVVSIDVKKNMWGDYKVFSDNGRYNTGLAPEEYANNCEKKGAGEILLNSIDRDGTYKGYDLELIKKITAAVSIPVIACGGAAGIADFSNAVKISNASAVAAGSIFVFQRPHNAVLLSYPSVTELKTHLYSINKI